tara:strand:+ start:72793 stop:74484 length:1692 start_codon:yes stop_codon:yes gene_type:complete
MKETEETFAQVAGKQLLILTLLSFTGLAGLMIFLSWASNLFSDNNQRVGAIDLDSKTITLLLGSEPPQLDSTRTTDSVSIMILGHVMEGLLRYDENNNIVAGVAEEWNIHDNGATFWLRDDARWSDGKPVTARDFVFAWKTALKPETASEYSFILYPIKNAEAINTGSMNIEELGVKAIDDFTLEVTFERPLAYFEELVAFPTYNPIREDFFNSTSGRYGADAIELIYNGPFMMSVWVHGAHVKLDKNPYYWDNERIKINSIDMPYMTSDAATTINLFRDGKIAMIGALGSEQLDTALRERWKLLRTSDGGSWFTVFNFKDDKITSNWNLRKALQLSSDSSELVNKIIKLPGYIPSESLFPVWLKGTNGSFRQEHPATKIKPNLELAKQYLKKAKEELGIEGNISLTILVDDSPGSSKQAEYFQNLYSTKLSIDVKIDKQIFKQRLAKMRAGDFDIALYGWGPDFNDPLTFGELFASWNPNNNGSFFNEEYDKYVRISQTSLNKEERMQAFAKQQEILINEVALIPNYERGVVYVKDRRLEGLVRRVVGPDPDFTNVFINEAL